MLTSDGGDDIEDDDAIDNVGDDAIEILFRFRL